MKAILNLDGFTKLVEIDTAPVLHLEPLDMDGNVTEIPFVRLGSKDIDGEEVYLYKILEPTKDTK